MTQLTIDKFIQQVQQNPDAIALVYENQRVTYGELNQRANVLAHYLRQQGVGPDQLVGMYVERSLDMVIGILGILKAGGAYVPMDAAYPAERVAFMLADAGVRLLLTQEALLDRLPVSDVKTVCLDSQWEEMATAVSHNTANPHVNIQPHNLAYVIYTSGSTGKPKGVMVTHANLTRLFTATEAWYHFSQNDVWTLFHSYAFDFSVWEIWGALFYGGRLVIVPYDVSRNPAAFYQLLVREQVTVLNQTPSAFRQLSQAEERLGVDPQLALRTIIFGGEALALTTLRPWFDRHGDERPLLVNMYGITETTVHVTYRPIRLADVAAGSGSVIGEPIPDMQLYLLDQNQQPVAVGEVGEIYVGGGGVARGYLNRVELTAERFVPDPFQPDTPATMYRSGDLARRLPNGDVEYLGRMDHQVKIRGFRIELGEIEAALAAYPGVRETAVLAREFGPDDTRLVAYLVCQGEQPTPATLIDALQPHLPPYMLPAAFVFLDSFPLTTNGKTDRDRLPVPQLERWQDETTPFVPPQTETETVMARLFTEILGVTRVGRHDDFFLNGGHSLAATQFVSRVRESLGVELPISALFQTPTVAALAARVGEAATAVSIIPTAPEDGPLPLSFAQQRLWFLDQLQSPEMPAYNLPSAYHLDGPLDVAALRQALNTILSRHDSLRTTFTADRGTARQVIMPTLTLALPIIDLTETAVTDQPRQVHELALQEAQTGFDLQSGPLVRASLLKLAANRHVMLITMHHIVSDGWSDGLFARELALIYRSLVDGDPLTLPAITWQYADFARWQRTWLQGENLERLLAYWRRQLDGRLPILELPTDRPRPAMPTYRGDRLRLHIAADITAGLKAISREQGSTLFMTLLAAFKVLLHRYSSQNDILVGSPIANRNRAEVENLIGFFVNTLVLRTDLSGDPTFTELVQRVRATTLAAYDHQDVPFEKLVEVLHPERQLSTNPLFQVVFALQNTPIDVPLMGDITLRHEEIDNKSAKFDLSVLMEEVDDGLFGIVEFNTDIFDEATIRRLMRHWEVLLASVVANPHSAISVLPLLPPEERQQVLTGWNDLDAVYPVPGCIHTLVAQQAAARPEATAVSFHHTHLTYRQLNERANMLAHYLQAHGVGPDVLVGLYLERSLDMVVAILAVLKAGGAYVPMDPAYPADRVAFMIEDARMPVLLTQTDLRDGLPTNTAHMLSLDSEWAMVETAVSHNITNPTSTVQPHNLAYVIYTSGSTGKPKGVLVTHANVVRLFTATDAWYHFDENDVWTLFHSYAFDFSVWEIWGALCYGGKLVVVPYLTSRSPVEFYQLLVAEGVTVLNQTPSAFRQLVRAEEEVGVDPALALRLVIFGGEALELNSLQPWFVRHGDERPLLVNMYGITETTVHVTYRPIRQADLQTASGSVIGRPIPDLQFYILDQHQQPVPIGVTGEIYVGGDGVALGYLNRPELTAQRFIPDPFRGGGATLYRSGDLARWLPDGDVEYLGRIDHQVKIRGFRIELGEIEANLATHPAIREVLVMAREDAPGEKRLVAYVVCQGETPSVTTLRDHLRAGLPEYMLPAAFVYLDAFPLTTNGKIDRRALPVPAADRADLHQTYTPPRTPVEEMLAGVWADVLGVSRVGIYDNFFDLGGDSILSIRVLAEAQAAGCQFTLAQLFQHQTIAELAGVVTTAVPTKTSAAASDTDQPFSLISPADRQVLPANIVDAYPLTHLQAGMIFHSEYDPDAAVYHNVTTLRLQGRLDTAALETAVHELIHRHPVLRTSFDLSSYSQPLQLVHASLPLPLRFTDLRQLDPAAQNAALAAWLATEQARQFTWQQAPLIRFHAHQLTDDTFQFAYTEHHAILDGWSVATLVAELFQLYAAAAAQQELPAPRTDGLTFRDFVALEQATLQDDEQRRFWKETLADSSVTPVVAWPGHQPPADQPKTAVYLTDIPPDVAVALRELARSAGVSLKQVLLAAHMRVLSVVSGQTDVLTGLVSNGRPEESGGERVLGLFLNTIPLRLNQSKGSWLDLLHQTARAEQAVLPFRRFPLAEIQRLQGGDSLFSVAFNYVHFHIVNDAFAQTGVRLLREDFYGDTNFDFATNFEVVPETGALRLMLEYKTAVYPAAQVEAIAGYYQRTLRAMTAQPHAPVTAWSPLAEKERAQLLHRWQGERVPAAGLVHELFAAQVAAAPTATAVVYDNTHLTFDDLNRRANQLAHFLQSCGVGPETRVAVYIERSLNMAVAALAVLKAGGAYLPVDTTYPADRVAYMLDDAQPALLLTHSALLPQLPPHDTAVICLDDEPAAAQPDHNPETAVGSANAAYIIYTSGSTGRPKGVVVTHRGIPNLVQTQRRSFAIQPDSRVLQFAAFGFDASVSEMFVTWLAGAALVLADPADLLPGAGLKTLMARHQVSVVTLPPSALAVMNPADYPSLRTVVSAGEACPAEVVNRWAVGHHFVNGYGPTEATVCTTMAVLDAADGPPPIGTAVDNFEIYVLDAHMQPAPVGVPGELYIGGIGLARGYHNRPALTAEKFVPHPFSQEPGARLYRTGDLVCFRPDGQLAFLGRTDNQVKLRGYRIELGEIEAALGGHEAVANTAVLLRTDAPGSPRLVAYVVAGRPTNAATLREHLERRLPHYMVPAHFVMLDEMPLTPNGKINRRALPKPNYGRDGSERTYMGPRNPTEKILVGIFADVLHLPQVGIHDNFFDLGGHSLLATQLVSRIRATLRAELPLTTLFARPTAAELAEVLMQQSELLPELKIKPQANTSRMPLSFGQQRLWFLHQLTPDVPILNVPLALRLQGRVDTTALTRACQEIVDRHAVLRSTFRTVDGIPYQHVHDSLTVMMPLVDLSLLRSPARETAVSAQIRAEHERPFNLQTGPLLRFKLLRVAPDEHVFVFTIHHIVFDGWSVGVFFQELAVLYDNFRQGKTAVLPPLPVQYADYARWQRFWLDDARLTALLDHWRQQLPATLPMLQLPTDRPRPTVRRYQGANLYFRLSPELTGRLRTLSQQTGTTLFMTLLAAFQTLLHRISGQDDILVGSPTANRYPSEIEGLIGFFVNTIVLRADFAGNPTFLELLRQVRQATLAAYDHQDLPFEKLVEALQPSRQQGLESLFQVMFVLQNAAEERISLNGLNVTVLDTELSVSEFDMTLSMAEQADGLTGFLAYNTDLFDEETMQRMVTHFEALLRDVTTAPDKRVGALNLLPAAERRQLLDEFAWSADRDLPVNTDRFVHELVSEQVVGRETAVAVQTDTESWTYAELESRANQLAHFLRQQGIGPDQVVAVYLHRSADVVLAMLAILKAGGVYLPLDTALPPERLSFMLADSAAALLVTSQNLMGNLPANSATAVILDSSAVQDSLRSLPDTPPAVALHPENLAYFIYTSGSTGQPKGVLVSHRAFAWHVQRMARVYDLTSDDTLLQFISFSFDPAIELVMMTLAAGARLFVRGDDLWNPAELYQRIEMLGITVMPLPTAYWHQLAAAWTTMPGQNGRFPLRLVTMGGEAMSLALLEQWQRIRPSHQRLMNIYGPTEATVSATTLEIAPGQQLTVNIIGRPIAAKQVYVLDANMAPVPVGVPGELYIGGDELARGYWKRPSLTAERFLPDPFSSVPGASLYRTGDQVRFLASGELEFLGRIDHQVKIRGYRIELGEIEAALIHHPLVESGLVIAYDDGTADKRLVAYVVPTPTGQLQPLADILRHDLLQSLPAYMVPSAFVLLDAFPMTANGKVDRQALPDPEGWGVAAAARDYVPPRTEVEKQLVQVWESVLGVKPIGVHDNYFDLGGHSLLAVQLFDQIQKQMGADLSLTLLFETPTVAGLAQHLQQAAAPAGHASLVTIQPQGNERPFFCVHGGAGHTFHFYELSKQLGVKRPFYGLQPLMDATGTRAIHHTVEEMAAHYIREMQSVQPNGPYYLGGFCLGGVIAYEMARQMHLAGMEVALVALLDPSVPRNLPGVDPEVAQSAAKTPENITNRADRHRQNLADLNPGEKVRYLATSARNRWVETSKRIRAQRRRWVSAIKDIYIRLLLAADKPIPRALRDQYYTDFVTIPALKHYRPLPYDGVVVLFRAEHENYSDLTAGFRQVVRGELKLYTLPADHLGVLKQPAVKLMAALIQQEIHERRE